MFSTKPRHSLKCRPYESVDVQEYRSLWYGEMLLRKLLLLRKPDYPAIVTFNADYIGRIWAGDPWSGELD